MTTNYTIYLVNQMNYQQNFWLFLTPPQELAGDPTVDANSSVSLAIDPNDPSTNSFTVPVQYVVAAGASNNAVGLNVQINSTISQDSDLTQTWDAVYANVPPNKGPKLTLDAAAAPANTIKISTNPFDQASNEALNWYASQSFGIQTMAGFIGMTWSPTPNQSRTLTPQLKFYVSAGTYGESTLADWTQVSNDAAQLSVPSSFSNFAATVTLLNNGTWSVTPGKPTSLALLDDLSLLTSARIRELTAVAYLSDGTVQQDLVTAVTWPPMSANPAVAEDAILSGTITVLTALAAGFLYFTMSGVTFNVTGSTDGATSVNFTYNGALSAQAVKDIVVAGANAIFHSQKP
ncbi:hypothetical protein [Sphingomonas sp. CARO-RG-8B-R24-01]|uniref:hypothetical protein n=1 Tax=Sphingomonas sp. CARO-RG-8B-R24-01 TaxID=2914831 RepID=UPI001F57D288|nr:hypothetical protein [Sphingomonas sp. CARO-RG-8B-R24-01]